MLCSCDSCGGGPSREGTDLGLGAILPVGLESRGPLSLTRPCFFLLAFFFSAFSHSCSTSLTNSDTNTTNKKRLCRSRIEHAASASARCHRSEHYTATEEGAPTDRTGLTRARRLERNARTVRTPYARGRAKAKTQRASLACRWRAGGATHFLRIVNGFEFELRPEGK